MRPIVPKVRVGDVLLGTKNLRNWLQTASLLSYVQGLAGHSYRTKNLYIPAKKDRFIVAVNAWETFGVWGLDQDQDAIILFCNPGQSRRVAGEDEIEWNPTMTPALFAQWFIRTRGRQPDLLSWPNHAYYLWGSLQMNAISNSHKRLGYSIPAAHDRAFHSHETNDAPKEVVKERVVTAIRYGLTRQKAKRSRPGGSRRVGPTLGEIQSMRRQISNFTANPRVVKTFKEEMNKIQKEIPQNVYEIIVNSL